MEDNISTMIKSTLIIINDFYEGKEENYDKIVQIINELHNYSKSIKMFIPKTLLTVKM